MTNDLVWILAVATPGVLLWTLLGVLLLKLRRRGRLPAGAAWAVAITGVGANLYPVLRVAGVPMPPWAWVPGLTTALIAAYGYTAYQWRKNRATIHGPWPDDPTTVSRRQERRLVAEHYRAVIARMNDNETDSDRAGEDAPERDETEPR